MKNDQEKDMKIYTPGYTFMDQNDNQGNNATTMAKNNRNLILRLIQKYQCISRKQLVEKSGLKAATVTIIVKELLEKGLIYSDTMLDGGNGRQVKGFSMSKNQYVMAMRITSAYIAMSVYNTEIAPLYVEKVFFETDDHTAEMLDLMEEFIRQREENYAQGNIICVLLSLEHQYQLIDGQYGLWDEKNQKYVLIGELLHERVGYRVLTNRAVNFAAYYTWKEFKNTLDNDEDDFSLIHIQIGYDLESAIIANSEFIYGCEGRCGQMKDLQIGNGEQRKLVDVATVPALLARAEELLAQYPNSCLTKISKIGIRDVVKGYLSKDALCCQVYNELANYLSYFLGHILNFLDPAAIFIMDEIPASDDFVATLQKETAKFTSEERAHRIGIINGERNSQNDLVLQGAARYGFQMCLDDVI